MRYTSPAAVIEAIRRCCLQLQKLMDSKTRTGSYHQSLQADTPHITRNENHGDYSHYRYKYRLEHKSQSAVRSIPRGYPGSTMSYIGDKVYTLLHIPTPISIAHGYTNVIIR